MSDQTGQQISLKEVYSESAGSNIEVEGFEWRCIDISEMKN